MPKCYNFYILWYLFIWTTQRLQANGSFYNISCNVYKKLVCFLS
uniref:Uncharacterized protein n=1 Tax=Anguilla anguilla TaxID=7936 RepID=A0A0E9PMF6_ANGAN